MNRRSFLQLTSAAGLTLLAAACGGTAATSPAPSSAAASTAPSSAVASSAPASSAAASSAPASAAAPASSAAAPSGPAATSASASASTAAAAGGDIVVGLQTPLTGALALNGQNGKNGFQMKLDEINGSGGINGAKISVIAEDPGSDANGAVNSLNKILSEGKPVIIFSTYATPQVSALAPIAQQNAIPLFNFNTGVITNRQGNKWLFRPYVNDDLRGVGAVKYAVETLKKSKMADLHQNDDYGNGFDKKVVSELEARNLKLVADEAFGQNDKDMSAQILKIKGANPDAVFVVASPAPEAIVIKQATQQGLKATVIGDSNLSSPAFLNLLSDAEANGLYSLGPVAPTASKDPKVQDWAKKYQAKFNTAADSYAMAYYDSVGIFAQAVATSGPDRAKLRDALANIKDYQGVAFKYSFDQYGDGVHVITVSLNKGKVPEPVVDLTL